MLNEKILLLLLTSWVSNFIRESVANSLPTAVALGGAIVAAVEDDEEAQEHLEMQNRQNFEDESFLNLLNMLGLKDIFSDKEIAEARGKHQKKNKILKHLYPILIGAILAKTLIVPLVLKLLTALSASSFIMAKIALAASGLLALKWVFADARKERTRFEIIQLPLKSHGGGKGIDFNDLSWSGSNYVESKDIQRPRFKYIPLNGGPISSSSTKGLDTSNPYRYGYGGSLDGKPFL